MKIIGMVPARLESSRLPEKSLVDIMGLPMVIHTCKRAAMAKQLDQVFLATDSEKIKEVAESNGIQVIMTRKDHTCGSDRIAEAIQNIPCDIVINIQGDEPLVYPEHIDAIAKTIREDNSVKCVLGYTEYTKTNSPSDIKAVLDLHSNIIYCSRTDLPSDVYTPVDKMKKLCFLVAFRKSFLIQYASWSPTPLEKIEFNEYLRILEHGEKIRAVQIDGAKISVDTKEDLITVRKLMETDKLRLSYTPPLQGPSPMNKAAPIKNVVFFLCTPSLGILDNWLPVIWRLKEKREDLKFVIIFPKTNFIDQMHLSNVLLILGAKIFDSVVFKSHAGHWLTRDTFSQVKMENKLTRFEWFLLRIIRKLKKWPITRIASRVIQYGYGKLYNFLDRKYLYDWKFAEKNCACILYDVYEDSKPYNVDLMKIFRKIPKFSIQHGININDGGVLEDSKRLFDVGFRKDIKAYLFSSKERPLYEHQYAIHKSFMEVVGVPRHTPDWMEFIRINVLKKNNEINGLNRNFIFIISRPGNTNYHSYKRKKKALKDIKRLAWNDLNKNVVVKLHPKERKEGLYEEVFGTDTYGALFRTSPICFG